jgi:hypothetical protein
MAISIPLSLLTLIARFAMFSLISCGPLEKPGAFSSQHRATKVAATKAQSPPSRTEYESAPQSDLGTPADFLHLWLRFQPPGEN